jgi:hypothetical protein
MKSILKKISYLILAAQVLLFTWQCYAQTPVTLEYKSISSADAKENQEYPGTHFGYIVGKGSLICEGHPACGTTDRTIGADLMQFHDENSVSPDWLFHCLKTLNALAFRSYSGTVAVRIKGIAAGVLSGSNPFDAYASRVVPTECEVVSGLRP